MPVVDLKNMDIFFEDGTNMTGVVNFTGGYTTGANSIVVSGVIGQIPAGVRLRLGAHVTKYKVGTTVETSGNTTTINFTPSLTATLATAAAIIAGPNELKIRVGDGNITWSEKTPMEYKMDRGRLYQVRLSNETPMDVSFGIMYEELTASDPLADPPTPEDALKHRGAAANWKTAGTDKCAPFAINIRLDHLPAGCPTFLAEVVRLREFRRESLDHDPKAGTISCSGKCNYTEAEVTRISAA